jgi:hypothetical protein
VGGRLLVVEDDRVKRSTYSWVAAITLSVGSILFFVEDQGQWGWVRVLRISCLAVSFIAFTFEARRLKAERQRARGTS